MRFKCEFKTECIPVAYQMQMISIIKEALKSINEAYYKSLYSFEEKRNKKSKNFTFGVYLKGFKLNGDTFKIEDRVILNVSSPDSEFMVNLYNGLMNKKFFQYKSFSMELIRVSMVQEKSVDKDEGLFSTVSPLVVKSKEGRFIEFQEDMFEGELNYIADINLKNFRGYGLKKRLEFIPCEGRWHKAVIKEAIKGFTDETQKKYLYVNAGKGMFLLRGDREDLNHIYQLGLGFRRNSGFGMLEIVD